MVKIAKVGESCGKTMKRGVKCGIRGEKRGKSGGKWENATKGEKNRLARTLALAR